MAVPWGLRPLVRRIGGDECTLARWERGEREPSGRFLARLGRFLATVEATWAPADARTA